MFFFYPEVEMNDAVSVSMPNGEKVICRPPFLFIALKQKGKTLKKLDKL